MVKKRCPHCQGTGRKAQANPAGQEAVGICSICKGKGKIEKVPGFKEGSGLVLILFGVFCIVLGIYVGFSSKELVSYGLLAPPFARMGLCLIVGSISISIGRALRYF